MSELSVGQIKLRWLNAGDTDLATIAQTINAADWEVSLKSFSAETLANFLVDPNRMYLLAYLGTDIIGAIHVYFHLHPAGATYVYVDEVDVVVSHRRHGVAKLMMEEVFRLAKERGADEVWLGTEDDNVAANALYNSLSPSEIERGSIYSYKLNQETDG